MKRIQLTLLLLLSLTLGCLAQSDQQVDTQILKKGLSTLYIVRSANGSQVITKDLVAGPQEIASLDILTKDQIKKDYPNVRADMVTVVTLKPNVHLLSLQQILDKYKIDGKYRNYAILDEGVQVEDANALMASEDLLDRVVVNNDQRSINLITKSYKNTLKARQQARHR
jgi:hypothetical protein